MFKKAYITNHLEGTENDSEQKTYIPIDLQWKGIQKSQTQNVKLLDQFILLTKNDLYKYKSERWSKSCVWISVCLKQFLNMLTREWMYLFRRAPGG